MGWCTLISVMFHPRKEIPLSAVKSPRRNTIYGDVESIISSSLSGKCDHRLFEPRGKPDRRYSSYSTEPLPLSSPHPKYSLPPIKIDFQAEQAYINLRTPAHLCLKKLSLSKGVFQSKSLESESVTQNQTIIV